ncbi:cytochrome c [Azospirillum rugosum]|uniref:Nicotinate dehydrogenase subunit B n=1 Tax=Azospirillum rugosum TaxID=416170 RepID=A0ABS4SM69_9PROT|nr:c-type cytochrome [Azospirillum rugosum]MBP2293658.1 nicotinate dehydrogenase subunit B [Azospirillum rugosum]MDQ0527203.1 nicotinate dehydrogenase subunit B [Azospirillum rugosum]
MTPLRTAAALAALAVAGLAGFAVVAWKPEIAPIRRPAAGDFTPDEVRRGATLATLGDCAVCHTAEDGVIYAGGRPLATPFGTLYATNITPDEATGIGRWSKDAFKRAMRDGVARDGSHLYPALPYDHYTHVTDGDLDALYAYLMTRPAVSAKAPENSLIPPLGFRPLLAGWKLLFLETGGIAPDPAQSDAWNRGRYLVEGLGHCGSCHTPRNLAGAEMRSKAFAGGVAEGWNAPPLDGSNAAARGWTADTLYAYLRTGLSPRQGAAAGPMEPVVHGLSTAPEEDVRAIATYIGSVMGLKAPAQPTPVSPPVDRAAEAAREHPNGAALFAGACAGCHGDGAPMVAQGRPPLSHVDAVQADDPRNAVQAILQGLKPSSGGAGPYMPPFRDNLTDAQVAQIAAYVRTRFSEKPAWPKLADAVAEAKREGSPQ